MKVPLHWRIVIAIVLGATLGLLVHDLVTVPSGSTAEPASPELKWFADNVAATAGQLWLRALKMLAIPIIFAALVVGIAELDTKRLGRIGKKTLLYVVVTSTIAVGIGLLAVNGIRPGDSDSQALRDLAKQKQAELVKAGKDVKPPTQSGAQMVQSIVPDNPVKAGADGDMIGILVFGLFIGIGSALVRNAATQRFVEMMQGLLDISMRLIAWLVTLAPYAVLALVFTSMASLGIDILGNIALFVVTVVGALAAQMFIVYPAMLVLIAKRSPIAFFKASRQAISTAFATASSNATLPTSLEVAEKNLLLPRGIARFVLTAGSTMNQHGTALFEGVTVLFLAQLFKIDLALGQQLAIMFICILGGVGTAGIPAGSLPVIAMILAMFGIPVEGLALVIGVDRLLDMCRTTLNVTGDLAVATCVAAGEKDDLDDPADQANPA